MVLLFMVVYKAFALFIRKDLNVMTVIAVVIFSIYTQVFSNTSTMICMMYTYSIFWIAHDWRKKALVHYN